jgi:DNA-binding protein HU-beta
MAESTGINDIANVLSEKHAFSKKDARAVIDTLIEEITTNLKSGKEVSLQGLGKFKVKDKPAREGRNPATGEKIQIAASKAPGFTPAKQLKDSLIRA